MIIQYFMEESTCADIPKETIFFQFFTLYLMWIRESYEKKEYLMKKKMECSDTEK